MEPKKETFKRYELAEKGKLILTKELLIEIADLHRKVGQFEWLGVLLFKKIEGDITEPKTLVLKASKMFLMDIGSAGHTEATIDSNSILDMHDQIEDVMEYEQGLIHTHHSMNTFFSAEDWSELNDNTQYHSYYLSLIVNFDGKYEAKVSYMANETVQLKYKNTSNEEVVENDSRKVMVVITLDIAKEISVPSESFTKRYDDVKKKIDSAKVVTTYYSPHLYTQPSYPQLGLGITQPPKREVGEVAPHINTFQEAKDYYRNPNNVLTYLQAKALCLDWLNEGLRMEFTTKEKAFVTLNEAIDFFDNYFEEHYNSVGYSQFINIMQRTLVDVTAEYQPTLATARIGSILKEYQHRGVKGTYQIITDLLAVVDHHPVYLKVLKQGGEVETKKNKKNKHNSNRY